MDKISLTTGRQDMHRKAIILITPSTRSHCKQMKKNIDFPVEKDLMPAKCTFPVEVGGGGTAEVKDAGK